MSLSDVAAVAELSVQLGYFSTTEEVKKRFLSLQKSSDDGLFVAVKGADVVGWLHVYRVKLLETDGYAEIGGVVVDTDSRRQGVGRQLLGCAEKWTAAHNYSELRLRSGSHRLDAHAFYQAVDYEPSKASYMFRKKV